MARLTTIGQIKNQTHNHLQGWPWPMMINVEANKYNIIKTISKQ
jgi:hypothetical protein